MLHKKRVMGLVFLAFTAVFFLGFLFQRSEGVNPDQHQKIVTHLAALRELDPAIDRRMLQIRHGAITSNDALVADVIALSEHAKALEKTEIADLSVRHPELAEEVRRLGMQIDKKTQLVENFKSYNAVAGNSLRFLNSYTHSLAQTKGAERLSSLAEKLQRQILLLRLGRSDLVSLVSINQISNQLQEAASNSGPSLLRNAGIIAIHAKVIIEAEQDMSKVMSSLLAEDSALGKSLSESYNKIFEAELHKANIYRHLLFLFALALMFAVVFGFLRLRQKAYLLRIALRDLESQKFALDQHAIVSITDVRGDILYVNDRFCSISGYERDELLGKNHRLIKSEEHSTDFYKQLWRTVGQGNVWHGEVCNKARNGSLYWVSATIVPFINEQGKPFQYVSIRTDITLQKTLERESRKNQLFLESITETLGEALYVEDADGKFALMNRQAEQTLGWQRSDLIGKSVHDSIHYLKGNGELLPKSECQISQSVQRGESYSSETEHFIRKNGEAFPVQVAAVGLKENNHHSGIVVVFQDITKRQEERAELTQAKNLADQANQAKSMFLANMSHEIRTPMNAIIGLSYLCLDTALNEIQRDYVQKIHGSGQMLLGILNDILDFSKIEAGKMTLETVPFKLEDLIDQVWIFATHQIKSRNITLSRALSGDIPESLLGDPLRLGQVLTNLLGNACKFTEQGKVTLAINGKRITNDRFSLTISISDTGIGMTVEQVNNLFSAFNQADSSTSRRFGGTGLGLSISQRLVTLMGSALYVESEEGHGSRFYFTVEFPVAAKELLDSINTDSEIVVGSINALLVEDNKINQQIAVELLKRKGISVTVVGNGKEAVDILLNASEPLPWDIVLMDIQMPIMDGYEASTQIRQHPRFDKLPIIAMTANVTPDEVQSMMSIGMNGHIAKPIQANLLYKTIAKWVRDCPKEALDALPKSVSGAEIEDGETSIFDDQEAIARLGNDIELYETLLHMWFSEEADTAERLCQLVQTGDLIHAERLAHTIKGTASSLGLIALEDISRNLEQHCHKKNSIPESELTTFVSLFNRSRVIVARRLGSPLSS